ncbi:MAG: hypothetical protein ACPG5T_08135, partial [Endozoicomonas sp.]
VTGSSVCWDFLVLDSCLMSRRSNMCRFRHCPKHLRQYIKEQFESKGTLEVCQNQDDHNQENCKKIHTKKNKRSNAKRE